MRQTVNVRLLSVSVSVKMKLLTVCCDVHMIRDRTCECRTVVTGHALRAMHVSGGVIGRMRINRTSRPSDFA